MRILITIPHYFWAGSDQERHGSSRASQRPLRAAALEESLVRLHSLFSRRRVFAVSHHTRSFVQVPPTGHVLDIIVVTVADRHLLADINVPSDMYRHHVVDNDPRMLGFECHELVRGAVGSYDFYAYMEDDLIIHDPAFFDKLALFNKGVNDPVKLLQPHRYELAMGEDAGRKALAHKVYNDYRSRDSQYPQQSFHLSHLGRRITLEPSTQPHAGCWFLNEAQACRFAQSPHMGWRGELLWNSHLDTAATLGLARTFKIHKTAIDSLDFFELQHACPIVMKQVFPGDGEIPAWIW